MKNVILLICFIKIEKEFYKSGNKYIIGNGGCDISVGSTSGSLKIR